MKFGFSLPHSGPLATPDNLVQVAWHAEKLGYDSAWTFERTLVPTSPRNPYPASPDGKIPDFFKNGLDPITTLAFVAGQTQKLRLGTGVLVLSNHQPLLFARQMAALDVLSKGRLICGVGTGWSEDEAIAAGVAHATRGKRTDEFLELLYKLWMEEPVVHKGTFFDIPSAHVGQKPVQKPHPPVILGGFVGKTFERIVKYADGWMPGPMPVDALRGMVGQLQSAFKAAGRDASKLHVVLLVFTPPTPDELKAWEEIGVTDVFLGYTAALPDVATIKGALEQYQPVRA